MPGRKASGADGADGAAVSGLRENELRFIKAVFDNMTQKPDADWSKVAVDLGLKDAKCAKERFRQMSVRHGWRSQGQGGGGGTGSSSSSGSGSAAVAASSPSKAGRVTKKRGTPRKKTAPKKEETSDTETVVKKDEDEDDKGGVKAERAGYDTEGDALDCY